VPGYDDRAVSQVFVENRRAAHGLFVEGKAVKINPWPSAVGQRPTARGQAMPYVGCAVMSVHFVAENSSGTYHFNGL